MDCVASLQRWAPYDALGRVLLAATAEMAVLDDRSFRIALRQPYALMLKVSGSISQTACRVLAQHMRTAGFTVEEPAMNWGTVLARRAKREGWYLCGVHHNDLEIFSSLGHFYLANTCADYPGCSRDARTPPQLKAFARIEVAEERRRLPANIQAAAYALTPSVMWRQFTIPAGYRTQLTGLIESSYPLFWQVSSAG